MVRNVCRFTKDCLTTTWPIILSNTRVLFCFLMEGKDFGGAVPGKISILVEKGFCNL